MWFPAMFYLWKMLNGFFKLWEYGSCWGRKCRVVMKCDGQDEDLADCVCWNPVAKGAFPGQVGFGLNASPRQIPFTNWRSRALWVCDSDITGSIGCLVGLQLVVNFRQSCDDLRNQGLTHDLLAPLVLQNPSSGAVLPSSIIFLACLTSSVWLGMCLSQLFVLWSFQACC